MAGTARDVYLAIREELDLTPSIGPTLAIVALDLSLLAAVVVLLRRGDWPSFIASQFLLAVIFFNSFSILHECGHGNISRFRLVNALVGHYASTFCFIPYYPWKYIHQQHHAWAGNLDRDPTLRSIRRFKERGVPRMVRACWRTWIPLGAFLQHLIFVTYPYQMWRSGQMTRSRLLASCASVAWLLASFLALWRLAPDVVRPSNFVLALAVFFVAEELVNVPHHVGMPTFAEKLPVWAQHQTTRSCYYPRGLSEVLVLNFNFHIEHHMFPSLPWHRLRRARGLVRPALGVEYQETFGISWNLENRRRDIDAIVGRVRTGT